MEKPKRKTIYKHCIVRTCGNNSTKSPGKAFIRVPLDQQLRHMWMNAVGRKTTEFSSTNKGIYVCEDHFDLESDMENYPEWKLTGEAEIMKKSAVPSIIHSKGIANESDREELNQLFGLQEEICIKIEHPEEDLNNKVNVIVSDLVREQSIREETVSVEGLINILIENRDLVACEKMEKQTPKPVPVEQNINLATDIQMKMKRILEDAVESCKKLAKSEAQSQQSDIYKKLSVCRLADREESLSISRNYDSLLPSENAQQTQDIQECRVDTKMKSIDLSCERQKQKYWRRKNSTKLRSALCPLCSKRIGAHLPRHLERNHKDHKEVRLLRKLEPNSQKRAQLLSAIRKRGYFRLKIESNLLIPVRASKNPDATYVVCPFCLGHYSKSYLHRHIKQCDRRPVAETVPARNCLSASQTFMAEVNAKRGESISSRLKDEVFSSMRPDHISFVAKNDPLIRLYGDELLTKTGCRKTANAVSSKIREMSRLLLALRSTQELSGLADALKPEMFHHLLTATKTISGYDPTAKTFKTPSLAIHMGTNLRLLCGVALDNASDDIKSEIQQLKTLLHIRWPTELSGLTQREKAYSESQTSTLVSDLKRLDEHIDALASEAFERLNGNASFPLGDYRQLAECVLGKTVFFNRENVDLIQRLTLDAYRREEREVSTKTLTDVEELLVGRLKTVVCGDGKDCFVLIPARTRVYVDLLLRLREKTDVVTQFNSYLFAAPGSGKKWLEGAGVLRKMARGCGAKNPEVLVDARFRNQIATTLQLMAVREEELERLATTVGLRSTEYIQQKAELARLLLEKQQAIELREKHLNKNKLGDHVNSTESEEDDLPLLQRLLNKAKSSRKDDDNSSSQLENSIREQDGCESTETRVKVSQVKLGKITPTRISWSEEEKAMVRKHFSKHIREKISPRKLECEEFLRSNPQLFWGRGWVQLKAFVYNTYRMMQ